MHSEPRSGTGPQSEQVYRPGVPLEPGADYPAIFSFEDTEEGVGIIDADAHADCCADSTDNSIFDPWFFGPEGGFEQALEAVLTPAPGGGAVLLLGNLVLFGRQR